MGLASAMTTALSGLTAAEAKIDVLGNNLANSQTVGFKESDVVYSTQFFQTLSMGSAPTPNNGGINPRQFGLGTKVAGISTYHTQGTITLSNNSTNLAIQGDGMFIVEGVGNEQLFSRAGVFATNALNELVTPNGNRLLGYTVDQEFNLQTNALRPLTVPLGTSAVAQATTRVNLEGGLPPNGTFADMASVVQSAPLGVSYLPQASNQSVKVNVSSTPNVATTAVNSTDGGGSHPEGVTYGYRFVFVDSSGTESSVSSLVSATTPAGNTLADNVLQINGLPAQPSNYDFMRVYRTAANGSEFFRLTDLAPNATSFTDNNSIPLSGAVLNQDSLSGGFTYRVTYSVAGEPETRPSAPIGPINVTNGRIQLSDLPAPPVSGPGDRFPAYDTVNIYRSSPNDPNTLYLVHAGAAGQSYTDSRLYEDISDLSNAANRVLNLDGPPIDSGTLLSEVVVREGNSYSTAFPLGTFSLTLRKGGDAGKTYTRTMEIEPTTRVSDLMLFMEEASGIARPSSANGIPQSLNKIPGESGMLAAGVNIVDGAIRIVSNNGSINGISIPATGMRVTNNSGITELGLTFANKQKANGTTAATEFVAYDSLGIPLQVRVSVVMESQDRNSTIYRWYADSPDNDPLNGNNTHVGTGLVELDGLGRLKNVTNSTVNVGRASVPADSPLSFELSWDIISGLAADKAVITAASQDGAAAGTLSSFTINRDGSIKGVFSNGSSRPLGQVMLAVFSNQEGLVQRGENMYGPSVNAGIALRRPGDGSGGELIAGALELSNVDIGRNLIDLGMASTLYRGNSRVISTTQQLLDELLNLRR
jgi:flagellar hook protein FlgE